LTNDRVKKAKLTEWQFGKIYWRVYIMGMEYILIFWFLTGLGGVHDPMKVPMLDSETCHAALDKIKQNKKYQFDGICIRTVRTDE